LIRKLDRNEAESPLASTAGGLIIQSVRVGLVGGCLWGWLQALKLSRQALPLMGLRQWGDVLSYSGLAHGLLWMLHGLLFGGLGVLLLLVAPRLWRSVRPGAFAVGLFVAGATTFQIWCVTAEYMPRAAGVQPGWLGVMVLCWGVLAAAVYGFSHITAPTAAGRILATLGRWAVWPTILLLAVSAGIQWFERPRVLPAAAGWEGPAAVSTVPEGAGPDVVLVVLDTQRLDRLGCYGYPRPTTPCIDRFAGDALVFDNYVSSAVWTLPSHASMFTGLFPSEHGSNWNHIWLDDQFITMAEILSGMGYQTFGLSNNIVVSQYTNLVQGFDRFALPQFIATARGNYLQKFLDRVLYPAGRVGTWLGKLTGQDQGAKFTNQIASRWLAGRDRSRPFFLFINYIEPHDPYRPTSPYRELFVNPADLSQSYRHNWDAVAEYAMMKNDCYSADELKILSDTYDAETRLTDDYLGQFLEILAAETSLDRTLVIITSDHGENLGDHHLLRHSWCVYDTLAHLPLIVRFPVRLEPGRNAEITQTVDLLPTVLDAVNGGPAEAAPGLGYSLFSLPPGPERPAETTAADENEPLAAVPAGRAAIIELNAPNRKFLEEAQQKSLQFDRGPLESSVFGIRQGLWKFITYEDGRKELFYLGDDPDELNNLIEAHSAIAGHLAEKLGQWRAQLTPYEPPAGEAGISETDEATLSRLRELGYVQ
jgi:arylsulfatase A-like enzyme